MAEIVAVPAVPAAPIPDAEDLAEEAKAPKWVPTILLHVFYPDSRKVGFGWALFLFATYAAFFAKAGDKPMLDASTWLLCAAMASALIGGGTIADAKHDLEMAKIQASNAPAA